MPSSGLLWVTVVQRCAVAKVSGGLMLFPLLLVLIIMMATLRRAISSGSNSPLLQSDRGRYQPVDEILDVDDTFERPGVHTHASDRRVRWAFWLLGAGILLSWNGMSLCTSAY